MFLGGGCVCVFVCACDLVSFFLTKRDSFEDVVHNCPQRMITGLTDSDGRDEVALPRAYDCANEELAEI